MKQTARVIKTFPDGTAQIEVLRYPACAGCDGNMNCAECAAETKPMKASANNEIGAQAGDLVTVETESPRILLSAAILYILPVASFIIGSAVGKNAAWGAAAVVPSGVLIWFYNRRISRNGFLTARIVAHGPAGED